MRAGSYGFPWSPLWRRGGAAPDPGAGRLEQGSIGDLESIGSGGKAGVARPEIARHAWRSAPECGAFGPLFEDANSRHQGSPGHPRRNARRGHHHHGAAERPHRRTGRPATSRSPRQQDECLGSARTQQTDLLCRHDSHRPPAARGSAATPRTTSAATTFTPSSASSTRDCCVTSPRHGSEPLADELTPAAVRSRHDEPRQTRARGLRPGRTGFGALCRPFFGSGYRVRAGCSRERRLQ